ncbi:MAG: ketoacyl-ACP synthase III, partial [Riemerella sp.]
MPNTIIIGSGSYIPERIIDNTHFSDVVFYDENGKTIDKPNEETIRKFAEITEIERRRYINDNENNSDIATKASESAIQDAGIDQETIDYIICASNFGEINVDGISSFMPSMSA